MQEMRLLFRQEIYQREKICLRISQQYLLKGSL